MKKSTQQKMRYRFYVSDSRRPKMIFASRNGRPRRQGQLGNLFALYLGVQIPERSAQMRRSTQQKMHYRFYVSDSRRPKMIFAPRDGLPRSLCRHGNLFALYLGAQQPERGAQMRRSTQQKMHYRFYFSDSRRPKMILAPRDGRPRRQGRLGNLFA